MNNNAADFDEARWRRLTDADAVEESLSDSDRDFLESFTPRSPAAQAEAQLFEALAQLGDDSREDEEAANSPLVNATVQHVLAARARVTPVGAGPASTKVSRGWTVTGLAAAAAVVIATYVGLSAREPAPQAPPGDLAQVEAITPPSDPAQALTPPSDPRETEVVPSEPAPRLAVTSGRLVDEAGAALEAQAIASGSLTVSSERGCVGVGEATACMQRGAKLELDPADPQRLTILEGEGVIEARPSTTAVMIVEIAGDRYTLSSPVTIETTVHSRKSARVEVVEGRVELVDAEGQSHVLEAGAVRGRSKHASAGVQAPQDAKTILARARASRSAGDRAAAISHYERLLRLHPDLPASHAAMVSLGDLYLDTRKPAAALQWFQRYLAQGGALAQEAHIGRIKALGALGRRQQEQEAIDAFRSRYPSSRYADQLGGASPQ